MPFLKEAEKIRRQKASNLLKIINEERKEKKQGQQKEAIEKKEDLQWEEGRRIVELKALADGLNACTICKSLLNLKHTEKEQRQGFGSFLYVRCSECHHLNTVQTNKMHHGGSRGPGVFDINTKAALGTTDSGIGARQLNKLLTSMGVPGITAKTLKKREREIKIPLYDVTRDSCEEAILQEIEIMRTSLPMEEPSLPCGFTVKYDMCWQKRGSGRSYSSPSGVGTVIGQNTGKVIAFDLCSTLCRTCDTAQNLGKDPQQHDCYKNWNKSAKAMEADTAARLMKILEDTTGIPLDNLIMDDDSSTIAKVKQELAYHVEKWSDINHSAKSLSNGLYALRGKHKIITKEMIDYFKRCFSYAVKQNKNDSSSLHKNLLAIVPHSFGMHDNCGPWCKASNDEYVYKSFPKGKSLSDEGLYKDLCIIFKTMVNNSHKLSPCGSTKDVESLHNIYASKAPKRTCYSSSESLSLRVHASVSQKKIWVSNTFLLLIKKQVCHQIKSLNIIQINLRGNEKDICLTRITRR